MNTRRIYSHILLSLVASLILISAPLNAAPQRVSRGDVVAVLHGFLTGGRIIVFKPLPNASLFAAVANSPDTSFTSNGSIRPLSPWDGTHLCASDWHVILLGILAGGDRSYMHSDASNYIGNVQITFLLDGQTLQTTRTPITRVLVPGPSGVGTAYGFQEGKIMEPGEITVGQHTLHAIVWDPMDAVPQDLEITFFMDDEDSPICN